MVDLYEKLIEEYDRGVLTRRDLVRSLLLIAIPSAGQAQSSQSPPVALGHTINHVQLQVRDLSRSAEFYSRLVGARKMRENNADTWVFGMPESPSSELTLRRSDGRAGVVDHFGIAVRDFDAQQAAAAVKRAMPGVDAQIQGGTITGLGVRDPDGILVQLVPAG